MDGPPIGAGDVSLLLGEWACLGILYGGKAHGFAIAARLRPTGDIGHVWTLSRPLTYRALDKLTEYGYIHAIGEERGVAGGSRTILTATASGRAHLRGWLARPVVHIRDMHSEFLLKLVIARLNGVDSAPLIAKQRQHLERLATALALDVEHHPEDVVAIWRHEASMMALRYIERIGPERPGRSRPRRT